MKRSKLFLGVTTSLLAIAGVAAAKHYSGSFSGYYITHGKAWCAAQTVSCTQGGTLPCLFQTAGNANITIFTQGPVGAYNPLSPANCKGALLYSGTR